MSSIMQKQLFAFLTVLLCGVVFLGAVSAGPLEKAGRKCWPHSRGTLRRGSRLTSQGMATLTAAFEMNHLDASANEIFVVCLLQEKEREAEKIIDYIRLDTGAFGHPMAYWAAQLQSRSLWRAVCRYQGVSPETPHREYDRMISMNSVSHRNQQVHTGDTYLEVSTTFGVYQSASSSSGHWSQTRSSRTFKTYRIPSPVPRSYSRSPPSVHVTYNSGYYTFPGPSARASFPVSPRYYYESDVHASTPIPERSCTAPGPSQAPPTGYLWYHANEHPEGSSRHRASASSQGYLRSSQGVSTTTDDPELETHIRSNMRYFSGAPREFRRSHTMPSHTSQSTYTASRPDQYSQHRSQTFIEAPRGSSEQSAYTKPSDRYVTTFEIEEL